jgi:hypothetical protein
MADETRYTPEQVTEILRARRAKEPVKAPVEQPKQQFMGPSTVGVEALNADRQSQMAEADAAAEAQAVEAERIRRLRQNPDPQATDEGFNEFVESAGGPARVPAFKGFSRPAPAEEEPGTGITGRDTGAGADDAYARALRTPLQAPSGQGVGSLFSGIGVRARGVQGPEYKMDQELRQSFDDQRAAVEDTQAALREVQDPNSELGKRRIDLMQGAEAARKKAFDDEQDRQRRVKELGTRASDLEKKAKEIADLSVDPERMLGRGMQRAGAVFSMSLANILGNVGEAMQGKAATNAVLTTVQNMIARDVAQQQEDRQFQLQGFQARETALGRTADMLKDERLGADAVVSAQMKYYEAQMENVMRNLKDAQARQVLAEAIGKIKQARGEINQRLLDATTLGKFQASQTNAQLGQQADIANMGVRTAEATARAQEVVAGTAIPKEEQQSITTEVLKPAKEKRLAERKDVLNQLNEFAADPKNRDAMKVMVGIGQAVRDSVGRDQDAGAIRRYVANLATTSQDPRERRLVELIRQYTALKESGQGGKAVTGIEDYLYRPETVYDLPSMQRMLAAEDKGNLVEKRQLWNVTGVMSQQARRAAAVALDSFYPETLPPAPGAPAQNSPTRTGTK